MKDTTWKYIDGTLSGNLVVKEEGGKWNVMYTEEDGVVRAIITKSFHEMVYRTIEALIKISYQPK